jgi:hypothetical protein
MAPGQGEMIRVQERNTTYPDRWFEKGSKFFDSLDEALKSSGSNYVIDTLLWSGANSVLERDRAANELAIRLVSVHEQNPEIESVVIGHSHGGNIAMRAAHYLHKSNVKFRIVTLATPFARVAMRTELNDPNLTKMYRSSVRHEGAMCLRSGPAADRGRPARAPANTPTPPARRAKIRVAGHSSTLARAIVLGYFWQPQKLRSLKISDSEIFRQPGVTVTAALGHGSIRTDQFAKLGRAVPIP